MPDFTLKTYQLFLKSLHLKDFSFQTFSGFLENPAIKVVILRHDVDLKPSHSLMTAKIESDLGIRGSYYFRIVPGSNDPRIICKIASLGHEIGYHYEDLSLAWKNRKGRIGEQDLYEIAINSFKGNLEYFRQFYPVNTICMHGSPLSRWDSRLLWKYYDYKDFGIIGEPYFDIDFNEVLYLTDTGRRWDGANVSVRDKIVDNKTLILGENWKVKPVIFRNGISNGLMNTPDSMISKSMHIGKGFHSTSEIIRAAIEGRLQSKIMITFHPQRWTNNPILWFKEVLFQNSKNAIKHFIIRTTK